METMEVHISTIKRGDTIIHDGDMRTVGSNNMKFSTFMGRTLFGDSYHGGHKSVIKVVKLGCMIIG